MPTVNATEIAACFNDVENLRSKQCAGIAALTSAAVGMGSAAGEIAVGGVDCVVNGLSRRWFERWAGTFEVIDGVGLLESQANIVEAIEEAVLDRIAQLEVDLEV